MKLTRLICVAALCMMSACTTATPNISAGPDPGIAAPAGTAVKVHNAICDNRDTVREQALHAIEYANTHIQNFSIRDATIATARATLLLLDTCPPRLEPPG